jgi:putative DNA primase/helicase
MFYPENIPQELKDRPQWVVWRYEDKPNGQATKVPYSPCLQFQKASSTDRRTWSTFSDALTAKITDKMDGIGFVFTAEDPYIGVDLDDCYDERRGVYDTDKLDPDEADWVRTLGSYTEVSPSNTGVKVILRGKLPSDLDRHSWGGNGVYESGRFFTITGNVLSANYSHIRPVPNFTLNNLLGTWFPPVDTHAVDEAPQRLTDTEVIRHLTRAANSDKFNDLWAGEWQDWYPSQSDADAGLIALLAFYTGPCPQQLDRLFRGSRLWRAKWDERRGGGTYGSNTIARVLALTEEYYSMGTRTTDTSHPQLGIVERDGKQYHEVFVGEDAPPQLIPEMGNTRKKWQEGLVGYDSLTASERPAYLQLVHEHVAPLAMRLGPDWVDLMALSFLSSFFPGVTIERLPLNLWVLGISAQGVGKSVTSDELELLTKEVGSLLAANLSTYTGGSAAGLIRLLAGHQRKVLCYSSEWTGLVKLMESEHSGSLREMLLNLYDGRSYTHVLAESVIQIDRPYFVANGLTTKANWTKATDFADTGNGFYSRFLFACPDVTPAGDEYPYRTNAQRATVTGQLYGHLSALPELELAVLDQRKSPAYLQYAHSLGMDNHSGHIDMDEVGLSVDDEDAQPAGRRLAQVKKVGAVLELLEEQPQVRAGVFRVREKNIELAVRLVQRGNAYARRAYGWLARSTDEHNASVVRRALEKGSATEYGLLTSTGLGIIAVRNALELLEGERLVSSQVVDGKRVYAV